MHTEILKAAGLKYIDWATARDDDQLAEELKDCNAACFYRSKADWHTVIPLLDRFRTIRILADSPSVLFAVSVNPPKLNPQRLLVSM